MPSRSSEGRSRRTEGFFQEDSWHQTGDGGFYRCRRIDPETVIDVRRNKSRCAGLAIGAIAASRMVTGQIIGQIVLVVIRGALILHAMMLRVRAGMLQMFRWAGLRDCFRWRAMHHCRGRYVRERQRDT